MNLILKLFSVVFFIGLVTTTSSGQEKAKKYHTVEIEVAGVCKMCKKRIEKAALIRGVKMAEWDKVGQTMKVVYKTKNVTEEAIHEAIAASGHDTNKVKAPDEKYKKLPKCCRYRDGVEIH